MDRTYTIAKLKSLVRMIEEDKAHKLLPLDEVLQEMNELLNKMEEMK